MLQIVRLSYDNARIITRNAEAEPMDMYVFVCVCMCLCVSWYMRLAVEGLPVSVSEMS